MPGEVPSLPVGPQPESQAGLLPARFDLIGAAQVIRIGRDLVIGGDRLVQRRARAGAVAERQVAARRQAPEQPGHDCARDGGVGNLSQDAQHHHRDGPAEAERAGRLVHDLLGVAHVGLDVPGDAAGAAGRQSLGAYQYERVVVDAGNPRLRRDLPGDPVSASPDGQASANVEELPDPGLAG